MDNRIVPFLIVLIGSLLLSEVGVAQSDTTDQLSKEVTKGFSNYKNKDSFAIQNELESTLQKEYYDFISNVNPTSLGKNNEEQEKARKLIKYYSTALGVEGLISSWFKLIDQVDGDILSLKQFLETIIKRDISNTIVLSAPPNNPNKYAILKILDKGNSNADIYLDKVWICSLESAKNGIRVQSEILYQFELKEDANVYCRSTLYFLGQERKTVDCSK